ncbi:MAG: glycosyl hydrolase family 25 [Thermoleophilia bacterium]|jgi:hypothetical protein|nr:glycosyl hydrolase family 25 [Thermoleophilia bacterium]
MPDISSKGPLIGRESLLKLAEKTRPELDAAVTASNGTWVQVAPGRQALPWEESRAALSHLQLGTKAKKEIAADGLLAGVRQGNRETLWSLDVAAKKINASAKKADADTKINVTPAKLEVAARKGAVHGLYRQPNPGAAYELVIPTTAIKDATKAAEAVQAATKSNKLLPIAIGSVLALGVVGLVSKAIGGGSKDGGGAGSNGSVSGGGAAQVETKEPASVGQDHGPEAIKELSKAALKKTLEFEADSPERKRADAAALVLQQASDGGITTTLQDGTTLNPSVTKYMSASEGVTPAADRAWNMDFVVWALRESKIPVGPGDVGIPTPDHEAFQSWMQASGGMRTLDGDGSSTGTPTEEGDETKPGTPEPGDIVLLDVSYDDMLIDSYGIVGSSDNGMLTVIQGDAAKGDSRGVTLTPMSVTDGRIRKYVDVSAIKPVARPPSKEVPPASPSEWALTGTVREKIVKIAHEELGRGVQEANGNTNNDPGGHIRRYRSAVTGDGEYVTLDEAWCGDFASYLWKMAGAPFGADGKGEDYTPEIVKKAKAMGTWHPRDGATPEPGDMILMDWDTGENANNGIANHVGIVVKVEGGNVHTIDGNLSNRIKEKTYSLGHSEILGYAKPKGA